MFRRVLAVAVPVAALALPVSSAGASQNTCPPDPLPGSTVNGGLDVVGPCHLIRVTVNGDVRVESTGGLELEQSTINGGIKVAPGGELDSGHVLASNTATFLPSTIHGTIDWDQGIDLDLDNATVEGNVNLTGPQGEFPTICESNITGDLKLDSMTQYVFGDPREFITLGPVLDCPGNTIGGSVIVRNSHGLEMESNIIGGSAQLFDSQIDFWGNQVGGSLQCHGSSTLTNHDGDATHNSVTGSNSCT